MEVSKIQSKDIASLKSWWEERSGIEFNPEVLSSFGYIVPDVAALYLYPIMGSQVCWVGWPISNPKSSKEDRDKALDLLFDIIHKEAKDLGFKYVWTTSGVKPVQDRLAKHQYIPGDININQYWRIL